MIFIQKELQIWIFKYNIKEKQSNIFFKWERYNPGTLNTNAAKLLDFTRPSRVTILDYFINIFQGKIETKSTSKSYNRGFLKIYSGTRKGMNVVLFFWCTWNSFSGKKLNFFKKIIRPKPSILKKLQITNVKIVKVFFLKTT